jgi:RHS repeat-associated protein
MRDLRHSILVGRLGFTWNGAYGYEWVPETGLYHVGTRAYDPRTARWLQRDPIDASSGDPNLYRYCGNDPINGVDPSGAKQPCIKTLVFTGDTLKIFDENGKEVMRIAAYSGLPGTTAADQRTPNVGPIPEGTYWIDSSKIVELSDNPLARAPFGAVYEPNLDSWGRYRVPLEPDPTTNTHGRSGFYLHGGKTIGSMGCIDVGPVNDNILAILKERGCKKVKVVVKYTKPNKPVPSDPSRGPRGARPWRGYRHAGPD